MFKTFFNHYHIRFQKEHKCKVLFELFFNLLVEKVWKVKKSVRGIHRPIVHVYALCWNEEKIIPFFLRHYNEFVDHYYIYDNNSDDRANELLARQTNVTIIKYDTGGVFNDVVHQQIKNTAWKQSRGKADWVIVIDMDEFLYHPKMTELLSSSVNTIFKPVGCNMVSETFPEADKNITEQVKAGVYDDKYSKMVLFNPHRIIEINYMPGAHEIYPEGIIELFQDTEMKLLHYKSLSTNYLLERIQQYRMRLSDVNKRENYGLEYEREDATIMEEFNSNVRKAIQVID